MVDRAQPPRTVTECRRRHTLTGRGLRHTAPIEEVGRPGDCDHAVDSAAPRNREGDLGPGGHSGRADRSTGVVRSDLVECGCPILDGVIGSIADIERPVPVPGVLRDQPTGSAVGTLTQVSQPTAAVEGDHDPSRGSRRPVVRKVEVGAARNRWNQQRQQHDPESACQHSSSRSHRSVLSATGLPGFARPLVLRPHLTVGLPLFEADAPSSNVDGLDSSRRSRRKRAIPPACPHRRNRSHRPVSDAGWGRKSSIHPIAIGSGAAGANPYRGDGDGSRRLSEAR